VNLKQVIVISPTGTTITLGSVTYTTGAPSGFTLEEMSLDAAPRSLRTADLPLVAGGIVSPGHQSFRNVELSGMIVGVDAAAVQTLRATLVNALTDRGEDSVRIRWTAGGSSRELSGYLDGSVEFTSTGSHFLRFMFSVVCPDPIAYSVTESSGAIGTTVTNTGTADVWPTFNVALTGTVTSLRVGNSNTGEYVQLENLAGATAVQVVTAPGLENVTVNGVSALNKLATVSRFPVMKPGSNAFYVIALAGGGSASGTVTWTNGWVE